MINELKEKFSETGPRQFKIEIKIKKKKLGIKNNNFKLYLDNHNSLFIEYNKAKLQNKTELNEETKFLYSLDELNKVSIAYLFTF
ncbi:hypothetical protein H8356DRAFT_942774 [Neocallimastix lanati (nom. inval.)]|nr:hypothetical protein H8356DRAFT_942774 [Neocallimastix sp. JGI-2020a]